MLILVLGFWAPWTMIHTSRELEVVTSNTHVWNILSSDLASVLGSSNALLAFNLVLIASILLTLLAASLRTWGAAYLGAAVVQSSDLHTANAAAGIVEDGPYRFLRNPLYLGTFLHTVGIAFLMPRSGAIFAIIAIALLQFRLIGAEEHFLEASLGQTYEQYYDKVPSLLPTLRPAIPSSGLHPLWGQALLAEFYFWGAVLSLAFLGWNYNPNLLIQGLIVSYGVSLILRIFLPKIKKA